MDCFSALVQNRSISFFRSLAAARPSLRVPKDLVQFRWWGGVLWSNTLKNALEDLDSRVHAMWLWLAC